ncbi:MAG: type II restriction endonuclease [Bacteroidetes bacterium]|nr:type II restriction endonuclease [Bacteroidota bacterium]
MAAKSSCKERWSQVLSEANRIEYKHFVTLEPGITVAGTDRMQQARLQLVVPGHIQGSYTPKQREWLMLVRDFVDLVAVRQRSM